MDGEATIVNRPEETLCGGEMITLVPLTCKPVADDDEYPVKIIEPLY
jgi:hypothetical protein